MNEKEWEKIFKALGNENRLKIIKMLWGGKKMSVSEIRQKLGISYKWTSLNLNNLKRVGILESRGARGQVFYYMSPKLSKKVISVIRPFLPRQ
ncbi:MAG: hypothetical protein BMS9Abin34_203 [Patescibacteria group bacterium]|nr:MAG: hypothetical protein BMS9Abin34_203 [Patescibacteria group bacterium]